MPADPVVAALVGAGLAMMVMTIADFCLATALARRTPPPQQPGYVCFLCEIKVTSNRPGIDGLAAAIEQHRQYHQLADGVQVPPRRSTAPHPPTR